ncbi:hypothetical protein [Phyllobacterium zundukense]|jgi:hypothetical protein|uniref:Uncharacterized protein n=1 Tax=Phyllobacterium zundukense TaxID=1867719 RepID=A0ACD4D4Z8_9HYPH|nr:hypothetical protein [Phyllobacterium zundukense]UXN60768.1 hypothetical protein N8E88_30590 [Phyllobacterium zundukense]
MSTEKAWYLSKTVWASIVTILLSCSSFFHLSTEGIDQEAFTDTIVQFVTALSGIVALFGRVSAKTLITRKEI